jgi:hypothetical protein
MITAGVRALLLTLLAGAAPVQAGEGQLVIGSDGRDEATLTVGGRRLAGQVRGAPVAVAVNKTEIEGKMADEPVWIWMRRREAQGHIGGQDVAFALTETPSGHLLTGTAVGHTVRLEESDGLLSFQPGCEQALVRLVTPAGAPGTTTYQGRCQSGRRLRVTLPEQLQDLAPMPRLILLALLLTEQDELLAARGRSLFPRRGRP